MAVVVAVGAAEEGVDSVVTGTAAALDSLLFEPVGRWFFAHHQRRKRNLSTSVCEDEEDETDEESASGSEDGSDDEDDDDVYTSIDAGDWKNQDHYAVMGLGSLRWRATQDDIKRAYKKAVLKHHPDKKDSATVDRSQENELFTCIQKANDILSDPKKRRLYDSIDEFDDTVPSITKDEGEFFEDFGPVFESNSRWIEQQPAPSLGDSDTPYEKVHEFYEYWLNAKSWREFGYFDEEDPTEADSREERRWIERRNKAARKKKKKEEIARLHKLVDNALASDPRIKRHKEEQKRLKQEKKRKQAEEKRAAEEARKKEEEAAEQARQQAEQDAKEEERRKAEEGRKVRRAFTKACKRHSALDESTIEDLRSKLSTERMQELCAITDKAEFETQVKGEQQAQEDAAAKAKAKAEAESRPWTAEEQKALENAMRTVPKDASDRWSQIAAAVPGRSKKECVQRVKELAAKAKEQKSSSKAPAEWTEQEKQVLVKAASKVYPPGTQGDRWKLLAQYVQTHAHTTWIRPSKEVVAQVNAMKNINAGLQTKKATAKEGIDALQHKKRDKSKPSESVPTQRF